MDIDRGQQTVMHENAGESYTERYIKIQDVCNKMEVRPNGNIHILESWGRSLIRLLSDRWSANRGLVN